MENSFQTSFIPKKPLDTNSQVVVTKTPINFFTVISLITLIVTLLVLVGFFFYKNYLTKEVASISESLQKARLNFEKDTIKDLEVFDSRVMSSKKILESHIVLSPLFELLGSITIPSIQYTKFSQQATNNSVFSVKMSGIALDYKSIAIQSDIFNTEKGRYFKNVIFSNLVKDKDGHVNFDIEFTVDPILLSYSKDSEKKKEDPNSVQNLQSNVTPNTNNPVLPNNNLNTQ